MNQLNTQNHDEIKHIDLMPVIFVPHGAGPMPLMGDAGHETLVNFLKAIPASFSTPKAILMISAHWENDVAALSSSSQPSMYYDYGGFPSDTYQYQYAAPGCPELAKSVADILISKGIDCVLDDKRGFDHGAFVPLMLMYPNAEIPVVQLSILHSLDAKKHIELGEAISSLREQGVLILGSGQTFHNQQGSHEVSVLFDDWLTETIVKTSIQEAKSNMVNWASAPGARGCHNREDHLLPLHVCFGAASQKGQLGEQVFSDTLFGFQHSGYLWR